MKNKDVIHYPDIEAFQFADGTISISSREGIDDPVKIYLHPDQLAGICSRLLDSSTQSKEKELERRLAVLTDKIQNLVCHSKFRKDLIKYCGDGFEYIAKLDGILDLALEYDGGRLTPEDGKPEPTLDEPKTTESKWKPLPKPVATPTPASDEGQLGLTL